MIRIELKDPILESIWKFHKKKEAFAAKDIMEITNIPYTTIVHRILKYESQGVLSNAGTTEETVGRPMNLWVVIPDKFEDVVGKVIE